MYKNNDKEIETRINSEIDRCNMAYKIMDKEGNTFVFAGLENGFPLYRTRGGIKHIFDLQGYIVMKSILKTTEALLRKGIIKYKMMEEY